MKLDSLYEAIDKKDVANSPWFKELERHGKVYFVGGSVRDEFIGKVSKDIDIVVAGLPYDKINAILSKYGKSNLVGKAFGIIKFVPNGETEEVDVAIPRKDTKVGVGHKDFKVETENVSLHDDLKRRDFTINAFSKDSKGNIYDPFNGREDLKNKVIRAVSDQSFTEDPLRLLRAVMFASRFDFTIEPGTLKTIQRSSHLIDHISGERIEAEFKKIVEKGNPKLGSELLIQTGLYNSIFKKSPQKKNMPWQKVKTVGEYIALLILHLDDPEDIYLKRLKGNHNTAREIRAISLAYANENANKEESRYVASQMLSIYKDISKSLVLPGNIKDAMKEIKSPSFPSGLKELDIDGKDLVLLGFKGKQIGDTLDNLLRMVYAKEVKNKKKDLLAQIKT